MRPENLESVDDRPVVPTAPVEEKFVARRANILVVDDTPANLQVLAGMLKDRGYKVPVPGGKLAIAAAQRDPPDFILLDINMPEMNGYEVCERLKADDALKASPSSSSVPSTSRSTRYGLRHRRRGLPDQAVPDGGAARPRRDPPQTPPQARRTGRDQRANWRRPTAC